MYSKEMTERFSLEIKTMEEAIEECILVEVQHQINQQYICEVCGYIKPGVSFCAVDEVMSITSQQDIKDMLSSIIKSEYAFISMAFSGYDINTPFTPLKVSVVLEATTNYTCSIMCVKEKEIDIETIKTSSFYCFYKNHFISLGRIPKLINLFAYYKDKFDEFFNVGFSFKHFRCAVELKIPNIYSIVLYDVMREDIYTIKNKAGTWLIQVAKAIFQVENPDYFECRNIFKKLILFFKDKDNTDTLVNWIDLLEKLGIERIIEFFPGLLEKELTHQLLTDLLINVEIGKIKKEYGFMNLNYDCVHSLDSTVVQDTTYAAGITESGNQEVVMYGHYTDCCQHYNGQGESSMLSGMVNHSQGFFAVKKKGIVIAQGWVWLDTNDTLVIDNIEFSNDRDCSEIFPILNKWLSTVKYQHIQLGLGYVEDYRLKYLPTVTETEMFWYKECNYLRPKDIYTDAKERVWLKRGGVNLLYDEVYTEDNSDWSFGDEDYSDLPFGYEDTL